MNLKITTLALALAFAAGAQAQGTAASAPAAPATPALPSSPAKKALVDRIIKQQRQAIEGLARELAEGPAAQMMQRAGQALQQSQSIPADKRVAIWRDIQSDAKKYVDDAVPIVRDRADKIAPDLLDAQLEARFTEAELRTLVTWLESPIRVKFEQFGPEINKAVAEKLVADTRPTIEPKLRALQTSVGNRLGIPQTPPGGAAPGSAPVAPPSPVAPKK